MNTETLSQAMRVATADLVAPADLASRARRGGQLRLRRRRMGTTAALSIVTLLAGLVVTSGPLGYIDWTSDPRLDQATLGDLASDQAFLTEVTTAWREGIASSPNADRGIFDDLRGAPHVYWAGATPAGPSAVVLQRAFLHDHGNLSVDPDNRMQTLVGLVAPDPRDGRLKLVGDQYQAPDEPTPGYFLFGPDDRTVLIVDRHLPLYFSAAPREDSDGRLTRDWQPLAVVEGVAVTEVPAGGDADQARVMARQTPPANNADNAGRLWLGRSSWYLQVVDKLRRGERITMRYPTEDHRLQWLDPAARDMRVGQPRETPFNITNTFNAALEEGGFLDLGVNSRGNSTWWVIAGLPDGRTSLVGEVQDGERDSRLYAVLLSPQGVVDDVQPGGDIDPLAALPVALRLPGRQGWVLAAYGAEISYRTLADGGWQPGGTSAALVPDEATHAMVGRPGSEPVIVTLAR